MIHEFRELIPVVTPLGPALALLIECNNHDNWWTVILRDTGAVITYPQQDVLINRNYSLGVAAPDHEEVKNAIEQFVRANARPPETTIEEFLIRQPARRDPATTGAAVVHGNIPQGNADEGPDAGSKDGAGQG